ncbi:hypothetical protein K1T35_28740 [Pseudonocardia sp. DSM 110487]|uniref:hypothetical protein n=1 Tax=Pseudonocardia sp. DSM 110487 TaxID=2865833 RepID=UPI001C69AC95|nr:hypothetical protein [Pseudonocardia sp. DSM 110487]QYN32557.1 hypothetical protein K1T35_28740 [Pseudonocardia sp. DSM 110487]
MVDEGVDFVDGSHEVWGEHCGRGSCGGDASVVEDEEVVAVSGGEVEVVECDDAGDIE